MPALITLEEAKRHLRLDGNDEDADLTEKALQASAIIVDYIKKPLHTWTAETVPYVVKAAIFLMLGQLYVDRQNATISDAIKNILGRSRDPTLA